MRRDYFKITVEHVATTEVDDSGKMTMVRHINKIHDEYYEDEQENFHSSRDMLDLIDGCSEVTTD